ncbi:hypothetical protein, partial [Zoogloea ramigera]|uniref:hypothetical protein n=1 Tax=Zoogloea ramigera TaxID=350 RepID=UPI003FA249C0
DLGLTAARGWRPGAAQQLRPSLATREMDLDVATLQVRRDEPGDVHGRHAPIRAAGGTPSRRGGRDYVIIRP